MRRAQVLCSDRLTGRLRMGIRSENASQSQMTRGASIQENQIPIKLFQTRMESSSADGSAVLQFLRRTA